MPESKIVAIMPARNSAWCLGLTARALLMWVDGLVVLDHASTDNTPDLIQTLHVDHYGRVASLRKNDSVWAEMSHRDTLLNIARETFSPTHIVIIDDDELISGNLLPHVRRMVEATPKGAVLQLPWLQLRGSIDRVHTSGVWGEQNASTAFPDDPAYCWRARDGYDHHHRHPMGRPFAPYSPLGRDRSAGLMHLQMVSDRRLKFKQYLYKLIERKRWPNLRTPAQLNAMYDPTAISTAPLSPVPTGWWEPYAHLLRYLDVGAEPWQEAEVCRMLLDQPSLADGLTDYGLKVKWMEVEEIPMCTERPNSGRPA